MPKKGRRSRRLLRPRQAPPSLHGQIRRRNRVGARNPHRAIQQDRGRIERHRNRLGSRRRGGMRRAALPARGCGGGAAAHRVVGVWRRGDRRADGRCGREVFQRAGSVGGEDGGVARDGAFAFENYRGVGVRVVEECECKLFCGGFFGGPKRRRIGGQRGRRVEAARSIGEGNSRAVNETRCEHNAGGGGRLAIRRIRRYRGHRGRRRRGCGWRRKRRRC
mmetsp:Transcript_15171/g.23014  ORF Transcript_15171/g.23014 Transcript_15171/m.23014 type:complete len:220 (-) Transcript_15171:474-1133(-)